MPIYDYKCFHCQSTNSVYTKCYTSSDAEMAICAYCGNKMVRVYSSPTVIYKGNGFYTTDNKKVGDSN